MKKHSQTIKGYLAGILTAVLVLGTALSVDAASLLKEIKVSIGGIQIYVDGNLQKPMDANGNVVEPMIYNGTTYLPVRALTGMLTDKEVSWDSKTQTVYIGKRPDSGEKSVAIDTLKIFSNYSDRSRFITGSDAKFTVLGDEFTPFNRLVVSSGNSNAPDGYVTYKLDSNYSNLHGSFIGYGFDLGLKGTHKLKFYNIDQYGTETLIQSYEVNNGDKPIDVDVNLRGVNFLKIEMIGDYEYGRSSIYRYGSPAFYNVTLTTAN
jgi:hypothetical protein